MYLQKKFFIILFFLILFNIFFENICMAVEPTIYSQSAILIDSNSGDVLFEKNSNALMYPASTTKVLTAIIALESCPLDEKITASPNAINSIQSGYTNAKIQVGETLTMEDLLYALLLKSANEAANVIAEHIGGSIENFANIMNAKAIELGCTGTHFVNANGIHNDAHYTTASDLAKITKYCMQNETFRHMVSTEQYTLPATEQYPSTDRILKNTNSLMIKGHKYYYPYAIGGKTGFTTQAKNCLIAISDKNGLELISVVLHAESTEDGRSARYLDTINLLEYGNNNYKSCSILEKNQIVDNVEVSNNSKTSKLNVIAKNRLAVTMPISKELNISSSDIHIEQNLSAPIQKGTVLGYASYVVGDKTYKTDLIAESDINLISSSDALESSTIDFKLFIYILLILILIRVLILFFKKIIVTYRSHKLKKRTKKYLNP